MHDVSSALHWRYATKSFDPQKKIPPEKLNTILEAARLAPSSFGLQPYHIWVIEDVALRDKLRPMSYGQAQITECSVLVVFQARKKVDAEFIQSYIELIAQTRGVPTTALNDYRGRMLGSVGKAPDSLETQEWCKRQAYLAMGFLLLTAAQLEIDACPMEGVECSQYDALFGPASTAFQTVAVTALGYRSAADVTQKYSKVRLPKETLFTFR